MTDRTTLPDGEAAEEEEEYKQVRAVLKNYQTLTADFGLRPIVPNDRNYAWSFKISDLTCHIGYRDSHEESWDYLQEVVHDLLHTDN